MKKKIAISIGEPGGIGLQLAILHHKEILALCDPYYIVDVEVATQAATLLNRTLPKSFKAIGKINPRFTIAPGRISAQSGDYSYRSFEQAVSLAKKGAVEGIVTLPIHKKAWELAGLHYKGHTDALRHMLGQDAIMMLGCNDLFVALFTEHIPLKEVAGKINKEELVKFLLNFDKSVNPKKTVAVLGLNPHAGDEGVLGDEERIISEAIAEVNKTLRQNDPGRTLPYTGPMVPDSAFIPQIRGHHTHYIAMYHDQGLAPLKALFFDESINISLNLPILRTSVDHGTALGLAYKDIPINHKSYINAVKYHIDNA